MLSAIATASFQFLVGPESECFTIHAGIIRRLSEPLTALMDQAQKQEFEGANCRAGER